MQKIITLLLLLSTAKYSLAQGSSAMDVMRESGKIYVVIAIVLMILIGFFIYLIRTDRRISKLEKNNEN